MERKAEVGKRRHRQREDPARRYEGVDRPLPQEGELKNKLGYVHTLFPPSYPLLLCVCVRASVCACASVCVGVCVFGQVMRCLFMCLMRCLLMCLMMRCLVCLTDEIFDGMF
ncbi:hypothetical protein ACOMHN_035005 [Nucella lapillus]